VAANPLKKEVLPFSPNIGGKNVKIWREKLAEKNVVLLEVGQDPLSLVQGRLLVHGNDHDVRGGGVRHHHVLQLQINVVIASVFTCLRIQYHLQNYCRRVLFIQARYWNFITGNR
jgi:hypothetical protein